MDTALQPLPEQPPEPHRRSFTLLPFDHRARSATPELTDEQQQFREVVDAQEEVDWQLYKLIRALDRCRNADDRAAAALEVQAYEHAQRDGLIQFLTTECRANYEQLVAREHTGKSRYADHALTACNRRDLIVRVQLRAQQATVNVIDDEMCISNWRGEIIGPGKLAPDSSAPLKWQAPVAGCWVIDKAALNKIVHGNPDAELPGVEIIGKPDAISFADKSRKEEK